jgi:hypothetical protein
MVPATLLRPVFIALTFFIAGLGGWLASTVVTSQFDMYLEPNQGVAVVGEEFAVSVRVRSEEPTNVFAGTIHYDPDKLSVAKIDYNTSIADLWAVLPWYSHGEGTVNFAGGSTQAGGFVGNDSLLTITFKTLEAGESHLGLHDVRILRHDGLGTEVNVPDPIDAIFTVSNEELDRETVFGKTALGSQVAIIPEEPNIDLNGDGTQNTADLSIFMMHLSTQNLRSDFDKDGKVSIADLSILTRYR